MGYCIFSYRHIFLCHLCTDMSGVLHEYEDVTYSSVMSHLYVNKHIQVLQIIPTICQFVQDTFLQPCQYQLFIEIFFTCFLNWMLNERNILAWTETTIPNALRYIRNVRLHKCSRGRTPYLIG
jgi:hypothetical protein